MGSGMAFGTDPNRNLGRNSQERIMGTFFHVLSRMPLIFRSLPAETRPTLKSWWLKWADDFRQLLHVVSTCCYMLQVLDDCRQLLKDEDWFARKVAVETIAKVWPCT